MGLHGGMGHNSEERPGAMGRVSCVNSGGRPFQDEGKRK